MGEAHLHHAEAAHGPAGRVVGAHPPAVHDRVGHVVGAGGEEAGVGQHGRGGGGVGAAVEGDGGLHLHEPAVHGGVVAVLQAGRVAVHVAEERLLAVVEHLHGASGVQRQQAQMYLQRDVLAGAECAAHAGQRDVNVFGRQVERLGNLALVGVQPLGGDEQLHPAVAAGQRQARLGSHEGLVLHAHLVVALHDHVGGGIGVAVADPHMAEHVAVGVDGRGVGRGGGIGDGGQRLVVHDDGLGGQAGRLGMVGGHQRHRLAAVAHDVGGEHRLVGVLEAVGALAGDVVGCEDGPHAGDGQGGGDVDGADPGVGVRRAQRPAPQHAVGPQVGGELERSGGFRDAVGAGHALADAPRGAGPGRRLDAAGRCPCRHGRRRTDHIGRAGDVGRVREAQCHGRRRINGGRRHAGAIIHLHTISQEPTHPVSTHQILHFVKGIDIYCTSGVEAPDRLRPASVGPVDVPAVADSEDDHLSSCVVDPVQDAVCAPPDAPQPLQLVPQRHAETPRVLQHGPGDQLDDRSGNRLREFFRDGRGCRAGDDDLVGLIPRIGHAS